MAGRIYGTVTMHKSVRPLEQRKRVPIGGHLIPGRRFHLEQAQTNRSVFVSFVFCAPSF